MAKYELIPAKQKGRLPVPTYSHVTVSGFHLRAGDEEPNVDEKFILTDTVQKNLFALARAVSSGKYAVLVQESGSFFFVEENTETTEYRTHDVTGRNEYGKNEFDCSSGAMLGQSSHSCQ